MEEDHTNNLHSAHVFLTSRPTSRPGEPLEPPPVSPARGPPIDWGKLVQTHDDREAVQVSPDELPVIEIHSL